MSSPVCCSKPGCGRKAAIRLTYHHAGRTAWFDLVGAEEGGLGLCEDHAGRFKVPVGWQLVDRRPVVVPEPAPEPTGRPALTAVGGRAVRVHRLAS